MSRLVLFFLTGAIIGCLNPCDNELRQTEISLDGSQKAVLFIRGCGATTRDSIQVSLLRASDALSKEAGNLFVAEDADGARIRWESGPKLIISYPASARVFQKLESHHDIRVEYEAF